MLKIIFPALMVIGAVGSLAVNLYERGGWPVTFQWFGAACLYTGLLFRNMG